MNLINSYNMGPNEDIFIRVKMRSKHSVYLYYIQNDINMLGLLRMFLNMSQWLQFLLP